MNRPPFLLRPRGLRSPRCFPSEYERGLKLEIKRFPDGQRVSEKSFNLRQAQEDRIVMATMCFSTAAVLSYRIENARAAVGPRLETFFEDQMVKHDSKTAH